MSHFLLFTILTTALPVQRYRSNRHIFNVNIVSPVEILAKNLSGRASQAWNNREVSVSRRQANNPVTTPQFSITQNTPPKTMNGSNSLSSSSSSNSPGSSKGLNELNGLNNSNNSTNQKAAPLNPRAFLFDRETIEKFAKEAPQKKNLTFSAPEFQHRGYMRLLKEKIEDIWKYPQTAARQGVTGDLYIKFTIKKDGKLGEVELIRTSGHKDLDEAAIKAIKDAEPYWPLPYDWNKDALEVTGHFIYFHGGGYIM